jgi:glycosyltransferase involved in cell wall biosynthesis
MADAIRELRGDADLRAELGRNGRVAVENEYNWDRDASRLVSVYDEVCDPASAGRGNELGVR